MESSTSEIVTFHENAIESKSSNHIRWLAWAVWLLLVVTTAYCAWPVWYERAHEHTLGQAGLSQWKMIEDATFKTFRAYYTDNIYIDEVKGNPNLILARWTGALTPLWTVVVAVLSLFNTALIRLSVSVISGHTLIIGDHPIAHSLASIASRKGQKVVHICDRIKDPVEEGRRIALPRPSHEMGLHIGRAKQARRIIIVKTNLGNSAELGLVATRMVKAQRKAPFVAIHLEDPSTAEHIHHLSEGDHAYAFSCLQAEARDVIVRHPPFLLARNIKAKSVHVLIIGLGHLAEALVRDVILNTRTSYQGTPWVTIIDPNPTVEANFYARYPEINNAAHIRFMTQIAGDDMPDLYQMHKGQVPEPVCAVYVCLPDQGLALNAAVAVKERALRQNLFEAPIFVRAAFGGGLFRPDGGVMCLTTPLQFVGFGRMESAVYASHVLDKDPDFYPRSAYRAYSQLYKQLHPDMPLLDWEHLSEEFRISNRRIIRHIPAKLSSLGFDLEPWLSMPEDKRPIIPNLAPGEKLVRNEEERLSLARLEHQRWMNDRIVNGWRYGPVRSDRQKFHPDLLDYDDLSHHIKGFDFGVIDWLSELIKTKKGGLRRE